MAYHTMAILAREVFFRRSLMMASGSMSAPDAVNIVVEKATTFAEAAGEATAAVVKGEDPVGVATRRSNPTALGRRPTCANCAADVRPGEAGGMMPCGAAPLCPAPAGPASALEDVDHDQGP